jgi:hypothetical protein
MPTFAHALHAELTHSGALERIRTWVDAHLKPWVEACTVESQKMCVGTVQMAGAIAERAEDNFSSKAYGPYLEAQGFAPLLARGLGSLIISLGTREADGAKRVAPVVDAIRFLARGYRQKRAILSRAKLVLAASKEASIVDGLFRNAGLHKREFLSLLQTVIDGGAINRERISTIAAAVASSLPSARGRKARAASAAHELFLETNASFGLPSGYTWSEYAFDFVDQKTQVTRREFDDSRFDPRPARRRIKVRRTAKTGLSRSTLG